MIYSRAVGAGLMIAMLGLLALALLLRGETQPDPAYRIWVVESK